MVDYYERDVGISRHAAQSGRIFIDIGANEGSWALPLSKSYETVHAFEPDRRASRKLIQNAQNIDSVNIKIHCQAVGDHDGLLELEAFDNSVYTTPVIGFRSSGVVASNPHLITVPCVKLDTFVEGYSLDLSPTSLIKIDVEGGEVAVLKGALKTLTKYKPDLFIEIHSAENLVECELLIADHDGYKIQTIRHPGYTRDDPNYYSHLWISATCPTSTM